MPKSVPIEGMGIVEYPDSWDASRIRVHAAGLGAQAKAAIAGKDPGVGAPPPVANAGAAPAGGPQAALGGPRTPFQQQASARLANNIQAQGEEVQAQSDTNAKTQFAGTMLSAIPIIASGGTSLAAGAIGGLGAGVVDKAVKAFGGSTDVPDSVKNLAMSLGFDAFTGAAGAGIGKGIGYLARKAIPGAIIKSAAKTPVGRTLLDESFTANYEALASKVGNVKVDISSPLTRAANLIEKQKIGAGPVGEMFSGPSQRAGEVASAIGESNAASKTVANMKQAIPRAQALADKAEFINGGLAQEQVMPADAWMDSLKANQAKLGKAKGLLASLTDKLETANGSVSSHQSLDVLVEMKGRIQQLGYEETKGLHAVERTAIKRLARELDGQIRSALPDAEAKSIYESQMKLYSLEKQSVDAHKLGMHVASRIGGGLIGGAALGGAAGIGQGHGMKGAYYGGLAGSAVGAALIPKVATLALEQAMSHGTAAKMYTKAVDLWSAGNKVAAQNLAMKAFEISGADRTVRESIKTLETDPPPSIADALPQK